mgnify:CR=1 FL=1
MKIVTMPLIALFITALSSALFAGEGKPQGGGDEPDCEYLPGIYSL